MDNIESNMKPQQTGGLKLMTVFVVVLALHVVVIGGMTTYYLLKGGSADSSMTDDKTHKGLKANADGSLVADNSSPDADKTTPAPATTPVPDASSTATTATPAPATSTTPDQTASSDTTPAPVPTTATSAPEITPVASTTVTPAPVTSTSTATSAPVASTTPVTPAPMIPITTPNLAPPAELGSSEAAAPAPVAPVMGGTPYVVVAHDSLAKIAHKNHTTVPSLMTANSLTSDKLSIGQKLTIPAKAPAPAELGTSEATAPGTTPTTTAEVAPKAKAPASAKEEVPIMVTEKQAKAIADAKLAGVKKSTALSTDHHTYTIEKGDTLTKIAHKFKTTASALIAANNITDPTKLTIGKKLMIPSKEAHTATVTPSTPVQPAQVESKKAAAQLANVTQ